MPRYIVKLVDKQGKNYYLEYSTVVDAPVWGAGTLEEFKQYYKEEYGNNGMLELEDRLKRVEEKGTSSKVDDNVHSVISGNHAGPHNCELTYDEMVRMYCLDEKFDEDHPCWKQREAARHECYDLNDSYDNDEIAAKFPYLEA